MRHLVIGSFERNEVIAESSAALREGGADLDVVDKNADRRGTDPVPGIAVQIAEIQVHIHQACARRIGEQVLDQGGTIIELNEIPVAEIVILDEPHAEPHRPRSNSRDRTPTDRDPRVAIGSGGGVRHCIETERELPDLGDNTVHKRSGRQTVEIFVQRDQRQTERIQERVCIESADRRIAGQEQLIPLNLFVIIRRLGGANGISQKANRRGQIGTRGKHLPAAEVSDVKAVGLIEAIRPQVCRVAGGDERQEGEGAGQ